MNKILTKVTAICVGLAMVAGVGVAVGHKSVGEVKAADDIEITFPGSPSQKTGSYSKTFTMTVGGVEFSFANWNNGSSSDSWDAIRGGQKSSAWTGTITSGVIANTVEKVEVNITAVSNSTGSKLEVASDASFTQNVQTIDHGSITTTGKATFTVPNQVENSYYRLTFNQSAKANGSIRLDSVKYYAGASTSNPAITLNPSDLSFMSNGSSQSVTVVPNDQFTGTPTISVSGTPSYVNCSVNGLTITVSPKAVGTESITINAVNNTEQASATLSVEVIDAHGHTEDDPFSVAEVRSLIDEDTSKTHSSVYVEGIISQVDSFDSKYNSITYWISDDGTTTNQFECYSGKGIASADFSSINDVEVGASVVVCGDAKYYSGTYEFNYNNYLVSYTAPTSSPLSSISLSGTHATTFDVGDTFSHDGLIVTAHYEDSSSKTVTPTSVSTPDMSSAGQKTVTVSYTENEVSKSAEYTITVNEVTYYEISFLPGEGSGTHASVQAKEGSDYELPTSTTFTEPEGKVFDYWDLGGEKVTVIENVDDDYEVTAIWKDAPSEVSDTLTATLIGVTSYGNWSNVSATSSAVYAGNSTKSNKGAIQMRSSNSNSGIVTTTSGGTIKSVIIAWNTEEAPTQARTLDVYAKASAYSAATDLYGDNKGTKVGSLSYTNTESFETTLEISGDYSYVGVRSNSGALYIDSITFVWLGSAPAPRVLESIEISGDYKTSFEVNDEFVFGGTVTATYDSGSPANVTDSAEFSGFDSSSVTESQTITVSYTENEVTKETTYVISVSEPAPVVTATYKKVKTDLADFTGDYLIVYEDESSLAMDGSLSEFGAGDYFDVTVNNEIIEASEAHEFHIAKKEGGYSIQSASGLYIGKTADSNGVDKSTEDKYVNTIKYVGSETSDMDIIAESNGHLRSNSSDHRFVFYKGSTYTGQKPISLYVQVEDNAEAFALDILNLTYGVCSVEETHQKSDFASAWTSLSETFASLGDLQSKLINGEADATGTFFAEALARYDILVAKYNLTNFMSGRVSNLSYLPHYESNLDSSSSITIIVIVAVTSMTLLGVTLVLRKRKHQ